MNDKAVAFHESPKFIAGRDWCLRLKNFESSAKTWGFLLWLVSSGTGREFETSERVASLPPFEINNQI